MSVNYAAAIGRDGRIDSLRGLLICKMMVTHVSLQLSSIVNQPVGFFTAAISFVTLAGLVVGLVAGKRSVKQPTRAIANWLWRRAALIYVAQIATMCALIAAGSIVPGFEARVVQLLGLSGDSLGGALWRLAIFADAPGYFGILPMYIIFMALAPVAVALLRRGQASIVVGASVGIWLAPQLAEWGVLPIDPATLDVGPSDYFNLLAWQMPFTIAMVLGFAVGSGQAAPTPHAGWAMLAALIVGVLFLERWELIDLIPGSELTNGMADAYDLDLLRLINFTAAAYLAYFLASVRPRWAQVECLAVIGRNALLAFSAHVAIAYALKLAGRIVLFDYGVAESNVLELGLEVVVVAMGLASLYLVARAAEAPWGAWLAELQRAELFRGASR
jgi:hypothetical protein